MQITKIHLVYYSATFTTRKVMREMASAFGVPVKEYDITDGVLRDDVSVGCKGELLMVGVPAYAGRVPAMAVRPISRFIGSNTPAIVACVYGNRAYDDTLIELKDLVTSNGFKVISAAAFIAQHSIFPKVGEGRPDAEDMKQVRAFAEESKRLLDSINKLSEVRELVVSGNRPYRDAKPVPIHPEGSKGDCTACLTCAKQCPVGAIPQDAPYKTDKNKCISCGRCVVVCPQHARHFGGLKYKAACWKFEKANAEPKQPEAFYVGK